MKRWQRIRVLVLQGVNCLFGGALIWLGIAASLWPVAVVGAVLLVIGVALVVTTLRIPVTDPKPPRDVAGR
ncbi:MAG: hypothetical protein QM675_07470 [Protaetiibacter sp.]